MDLGKSTTFIQFKHNNCHINKKLLLNYILRRSHTNCESMELQQCNITQQKLKTIALGN